VQLARYLHAEDGRHEIPPAGHFPGSRPRPVPYIYTPDEARRLVAVAARLSPAGSLRPRTMSTMLALLFATGLRISEALALDIGDVTSDGLRIRQTKFGKRRLVPLHPSVQDGLAQYLRCRRATVDGTAPVFVSLADTRLSYGGFRKAWRLVLGRAGLSARPGGHRPRVHDIRHTFAARALETAPDQRDRIAQHKSWRTKPLTHRRARFFLSIAAGPVRCRPPTLGFLPSLPIRP